MNIDWYPSMFSSSIRKHFIVKFFNLGFLAVLAIKTASCVVEFLVCEDFNRYEIAFHGCLDIWQTLLFNKDTNFQRQSITEQILPIN